MKKKNIYIVIRNCDRLDGLFRLAGCTTQNIYSGDDLFESEAGFKDVLTGFYLKMGQTSLYAENLTYGYLEVMSGNYDYYPDVVLKDIYDYDNKWLSVKDNIYGSMYNIIANINNFFEVYRQESFCD